MRAVPSPIKQHHTMTPSHALEPCELTILMPCLDEAETLAACIEEANQFIRQSGINGEVLIADNGSVDGSQAIARALNARVVDVPEKGYGAALIAGIHSARGKFIIMGDSDQSYDFGDAGGLLQALRTGSDLVMGDRFAGGIDPGAMPFLHRYLGNPVLSFIGRLFFRAPIRDFHCGLRGFNKARILALNLLSPGMEFASEMVVRASISKYKISEVPVKLRKDGRSRPPHLKTWRDGWRHLKFLLVYSPKWLFLYPGIFLFLFGMVMSWMLMNTPVSIGTARLDTLTLVGASSFVLIGLQLITLAIASKKIGVLHGYLSPPKQLNDIYNISVERILQISLIPIFAGLWGAGGITLDWMTSEFSEIKEPSVLRHFIVFTILLVTGIQIACAGFMLAVVEASARGKR